MLDTRADAQFGCSCYTMLQQLNGWLGCARMVKAHGVHYETFVYSRPDIYYGTSIPPPRQLNPHTLYAPGVNTNAMLDTLLYGPYHMVDVALHTLHFLVSGRLYAGPHGWVPRGFEGAKRYGDVSGGGLENLMSANVRLMHNFTIGCLNPWKPYPQDCPAYQGFAQGAFAHVRVQAQGHPALSCEQAGVRADKDETTRSICSKSPLGSRG